MSFSPLIGQRTLTPNGNTDCGEAVVLMILRHLGHNVAAEQVMALHNSYTDIDMVQTLLIDFGIKGSYITGSGFDNNDKIVAVLFKDDATAEPNVAGPYTHYGAAYAQDAANLYMANPWLPSDDTVPLWKFNPAYIAGVVVPVSINRIAAPQPAAPAQAPASTSNGVNDMTTGESASLNWVVTAMQNIYPIVVQLQGAEPGIQAALAALTTDDAATKANVANAQAALTALAALDLKNVADLHAEMVAAIAAGVGEAEQTAAQMLTKPAPNPTPQGGPA
jgi:hypothetical protein